MRQILTLNRRQIPLLTIRQFGLAFIVALLTSAISGCANHYTFSSNLDRQNFEQYFAPSHVKVFPNASDLPMNSQYLGVIEGQDCQAKVHLAEPSMTIAKTDALRNAYAKKANAVVFTGCASVSTKQCVQQLICYGEAYQLLPAVKSTHSTQQP